MAAKKKSTKKVATKRTAAKKAATKRTAAVAPPPMDCMRVARENRRLRAKVKELSK